jgi:putative membrane-bound dehydrogenase-like protein
MTIYRNLHVAIAMAFCFGFLFATAGAQDNSPAPIRALLIAGGCCHDYARQHEILSSGIQSRANVRVDVYWTDDSTTSPEFPLYRKLNWAEDYDVIIHDECAADIKDVALVNRIVEVHRTIPAVHLHCAMHSFRTGNDTWFQHLGFQSSSHGPQEPIDIKFVAADHPITAPLENWTTIREELYNNVRLIDAFPLATGTQRIPGDRPSEANAVVAWVNESQGARSFSTTLGHNNETVEDPRYLELVTRGLLWACGKLSPEYLQPYQGEHTVTKVDPQKLLGGSTQNLGPVPADATLVKVSVSSTQAGHPANHAIDGDGETRWCADGGGFPQSIRLEFDQPYQVDGVDIRWEFLDRSYQYQLEGSIDGSEWKPISGEQGTESELQAKSNSAVRFLRITVTGGAPGSWCSIREIDVRGPEIGTLWPADPAVADTFTPLQGDPYARGGNTPPRIERISEEAERAILRDVKVPDGFEATVFAAPPAVNYPVFVAATVDGTLFVSSDGNGSLGRDPARGRVIRLRDLDGDGRADESKVFCEVDAPRGLVWDRDRLYVMHPPNLSVFLDVDNDGVADQQRTLVRNLAFDYDDRPADHTTNGLSIGVDGWLYIAGGDFGFIDATGTDGRTLTHRGGGVIRVRPDGSKLELFSTGTRNILEVAISPEMEMFARDNTNDGGGWDVRFHHFTGNDDHGYPRLFKNFPDQCVPPLADYGGGSGCGAVYIDEPGFGAWNDAPFTADWGTGAIYHHSLRRQGATFAEATAPRPFIEMTRPTDADVDGNSRVYCASWRGATFNWNGPDVGFIVCVRPREYSPPPMPDFANLGEEELIALFDSDSHRRRLAAQRELVHRGSESHLRLYQSAIASRGQLRNLLDALQTDSGEQACLSALSHTDPLVVHTAIRCLADQQSVQACLSAWDDGSAPKQALGSVLSKIHQPEVVDGLIARLETAEGAVKRELLAALCRLHFREGIWTGSSWGTRPDTRGPYYQPEPWSETSRIRELCDATLAKASPEDAAWLLETMRANRIETNDSLARLVARAGTDDRWVAAAIRQSAAADFQSPGLQPILARAVKLKSANADLMIDTLTVLGRTADAYAGPLLLDTLVRLDNLSDAQIAQQARRILENAPRLDDHLHLFIEVGNRAGAEESSWADVGLLMIASGKNGSPETRILAEQAIAAAWESLQRRRELMVAAEKSANHYLDDRIWKAQEDSSEETAKIARSVVQRLGIEPSAADTTPKIGTLALPQAKRAVLDIGGDLATGQRVFAKASCANCHTIGQAESQKGPYLGNIAKTYKRPELIDALLEPNKTIAQGFATNSFLTVDGVLITGFVTSEQADRVVVRDSTGKEFTIMTADIETRRKLETSVMPTGLLDTFTTHEVASLVKYLENLAQ